MLNPVGDGAPGDDLLRVVGQAGLVLGHRTASVSESAPSVARSGFDLVHQGSGHPGSEAGYER